MVDVASDGTLWFVAKFYDTDVNTGKTGLSADLTLNIRPLNGGVHQTVATITELDSTNQPGVYYGTLKAPGTLGPWVHTFKYGGAQTDLDHDDLTGMQTVYDASTFQATGFSTHSAADVWTQSTRTITGGTLTDSSITANTFATDAITADKIAADAIGASELATGAVDEIVDAVWDEVITGAAHNVTNSSARFLREAAEGIGITGTAQAGAASTITLATGESATSNLYNGERIFIIEGTGKGQARLITAYDGGTKVATVDRNWTVNPSSDSVYSIVGADVDIRAIEGDAAASDNLKAMYDGTGYAGGTTKLDVNTVTIEGSDATDQINAAADTALTDYDPPTRAELTSDINSLNNFDPANDTVVTVGTVVHVGTLSNNAAAQVNAEADTALTDYDPPTNAEMEARTLAAASYFDPAADTVVTVGTVTLVGTLSDNAAAQVNAEADTALSDYDPPTRAELTSDISSLNDLSAAQVNAEVDSAIVTYHLDHLFAADYDPASKPGVATALLNELIGDDGGVAQFTTNALETAPGGGAVGTVTHVGTLSTNALEDMADFLLRRNFATAESSSTGDTLTGRSLLGAGAHLTNRVRIAGGTKTVYRTDDSTSLYTQTVTTDATAEYVIEVNTD